MATFNTQSNGATVTLPARTKAFQFTLWGGGGGSGGVDAGGTGGRGGDGSKIVGTAVLTTYGQTVTCIVGGGGSGGGGCVTGSGGGPGGGGSIPGGKGGNAGGNGCSGGGGGGGGASAVYLGSTVVAVAGGGGGGGGANLETGQSGGGGDGINRAVQTAINITAGANGTNKSGDGAGAGAGGGGNPGGGTGNVGTDRSVGATGGGAGFPGYNTTYVSSVTHTSNSSESYGYGTPNGNSIDGTAGRVSVLYPELTYYGIAVGTQNAVQGNVSGTVGDSVEVSWATTDVGNVSINGVSKGNGNDNTVYQETYTGLSAGTTTFTLTGGFNGVTGVEQSRSVTLYQPPTINSFTASPSTYVTTNNAITLTWNTTNAVQVDIEVSRDGGSVSTIVNNGSADGSTTYTPTSAGTYLFTLYAENTIGTGLGRVSTTTTVIAVNPPVIDAFAADPNPVLQDTQFLLSWATTDANTISIPGVGSSLTADGSQTLTATEPTGAGAFPGAPTYGNGYRDYTLTATNLAGTSVTDTERVFIEPQPPIPSLSVTPDTINYGESVTLTWSNQYVTSASIDNGVGTISPVTSGTVSKTITGNIQDFVTNNTVTITMSVAGYGGTDSDSVYVTVVIDTTPTAWVFSNKTGATINTVYYASSNTTSPL